MNQTWNEYSGMCGRVLVVCAFWISLNETSLKKKQRRVRTRKCCCLWEEKHSILFTFKCFHWKHRMNFFVHGTWYDSLFKYWLTCITQLANSQTQTLLTNQLQCKRIHEIASNTVELILSKLGGIAECLLCALHDKIDISKLDHIHMESRIYWMCWTIRSIETKKIETFWLKRPNEKRTYRNPINAK